MKKYCLYFPLIAIAILLVPLLVYYFPYVSGKQLDLMNRDFRVLSATSHQIQEKLDDFGQVLKAAEDKHYFDRLVRELKYESPCVKREFPEQTAAMISQEPEGSTFGTRPKEMPEQPPKLPPRCAPRVLSTRSSAPLSRRSRRRRSTTCCCSTAKGGLSSKDPRPACISRTYRVSSRKPNTSGATQKKPEESATASNRRNPDSSQLVEVPLAGISYKAFLEPVPLRLVNGRQAGQMAQSRNLEGWPSTADMQDRASPILNRGVLSGLAALAVGVFFWIRSTAKKLAALTLNDTELEPYPDWNPCASQADRNLLVLALARPGEGPSLKDTGAVFRVDVGEAARRNHWTVYPGDAPVVILDRFEFQMDDAECTAGKLMLLEHLLFIAKKKIVILSLIDPMFYWFEGGQSAQAFTPQERDRWTRVFSAFATGKWEPAEAQWESPAARHRFLWSTCSRREKLLLFQLAKDGWVNPGSPAVIRHLARRGLIRRDGKSGTLAFSESDFGSFVVSALDASQYVAMAPENTLSAWRGWKFAMMMVVVLMLVFLFFAWAEFFEGGLGWVAASLTALPAALNTANQIKSRFRSAAAGAE